MEHTVKSAFLRGMFRELPAFSHENHGKKFFRFTLDVPRLSGTIDCIPVIAEESLLENLDTDGGDMIAVTGQIRSHNVREGTVRHLMIFLFAESVCTDSGDPVNEVTVEGPLCREPVYRRTPMGREICDAMIAVPRAFRRADYLPCILWGRIAQEVSCRHTRELLHIEGRIQSRTYTKQTENGPLERTAYEISALTACFPDSEETD